MAANRSLLRLSAQTAIQLLLVAVLLEFGLRLLAAGNADLRTLAYNAGAGSDYGAIESLPELLGKAPLGFRPLTPAYGFRLNSKSFRTHEYLADKPAGTFRVLALGDSFAFGSGGIPYLEHWPKSWESALQPELESPLELINLGVGGVGPLFQLRLWQLEGRQLEPDLVVVALCIGNDFTDEQSLDLKPSRADWWVRHSYLVRIARNLYRYRAARDQISATTAGMEVDTEVADAGEGGGYPLPGYRYDPDQPTFSEAQYLRLVGQRMRITLNAEADEFERLFHRLTGILNQLAESVQSTDADFMIMLIPEEWQVTDPLFTAAAGKAGHRLADYDRDLPQRRLRAFCAERGLDCLDLLPAFRFAARRERLYKPRDTHWNIAGNDLAVELLVDWFRRRYLDTRDTENRR